MSGSEAGAGWESEGVRVREGTGVGEGGSELEDETCEHLIGTVWLRVCLQATAWLQSLWMVGCTSGK